MPTTRMIPVYLHLSCHVVHVGSIHLTATLHVCQLITRYTKLHRWLVVAPRHQVVLKNRKHWDILPLKDDTILSFFISVFRSSSYPVSQMPGGTQATERLMQPIRDCTVPPAYQGLLDLSLSSDAILLSLHKCFFEKLYVFFFFFFLWGDMKWRYYKLQRFLC